LNFGDTVSKAVSGVLRCGNLARPKGVLNRGLAMFSSVHLIKKAHQVNGRPG
jgi:hypothetical protein